MQRQTKVDLWAIDAFRHDPLLHRQGDTKSHFKDISTTINNIMRDKIDRPNVKGKINKLKSEHH